MSTPCTLSILGKGFGADWEEDICNTFLAEGRYVFMSPVFHKGADKF